MVASAGPTRSPSFPHKKIVTRDIVSHFTIGHCLRKKLNSFSYHSRSRLLVFCARNRLGSSLNSTRMISNHFTPKIGVEVAILKREKTQGGRVVFSSLSGSFPKLFLASIYTTCRPPFFLKPGHFRSSLWRCEFSDHFEA